MARSKKHNRHTGFWVLLAALAVVAVVVYNYAKTDTPFSSAAPVGSAVYLYVATDGNDMTGDGSYFNPLRTFRQAATQISPDGITYIYPKGNLVLSRHESPPSSEAIPVPDGADVRITQSLVGSSIASQHTRVSSGPAGGENLPFSVGDARFTISKLEWESVRFDISAGANSIVTINDNMMFSIQPPGQPRLPGRLLIRTADKSASVQIFDNTFDLPNAEIECCSINAIQIMHNQAGEVTIFKNRIYYPYIKNRLAGPRLDYEGIFMWNRAADKGTGISILNNLFENISPQLAREPEGEAPSDYGIRLWGANNTRVEENDFTRFYGTPITP